MVDSKNNTVTKGVRKMTENKRFRVNDLVKYNYSEIGEYIDENHTDKPLRNDILVELLNELAEENEQSKMMIATLRNMVLDQEDLEKENKELRSDRDYWKKLAQALAKNNGNVKLKDEHLAWKRVD